MSNLLLSNQFSIKLFLILVIGFLSQFSFAQGSVVGNGGDGIAIEFQNLARGISQNLESSPSDAGFSVKIFAQLTREAEIRTENRLFLRDREVDAINYPTLKRIVISRSRWLITSRSVPAMVSLVFHEILGLMNIQNDEFVKKYTDRYIENFVNLPGDNRPQLLVHCQNSLTSDQVTQYFPKTSPMGFKNFLIYRQNKDYLLYYQDNLLLRSMRPYETIDYFMGYFKCHMNPDRTSIVCGDPPCSQIVFQQDPSREVFAVHLKVDRLTEGCKVPPAQLVPTVLNYVRGDLAFEKNQCQMFVDKKASDQ